MVEALVDEFYERILDDASLAPCFEGIDMARLRAHQRTFIAAAIGGPEQYMGSPLDAAHSRLEISDSMFDRTIHHLRTTLIGLGFDPETIREMSERIGALRDDVVTSADPPRVG